jgi:hypothetical protein
MACKHFAIDAETGACRECGIRPVLEPRRAPAFLRDDAAMQWHLAKQAFRNLSFARARSASWHKIREAARVEAAAHLETFKALRAPKILAAE